MTIPRLSQKRRQKIGKETSMRDRPRKIKSRHHRRTSNPLLAE